MFVIILPGRNVKRSTKQLKAAFTMVSQVMDEGRCFARDFYTAVVHFLNEKEFRFKLLYKVYDMTTAFTVVEGLGSFFWSLLFWDFLSLKSYLFVFPITI